MLQINGKMTKEQAINYLFSSGFSKEQVNGIIKAFEPTTKNDLAVDCISRKSIKQKLQEHHDFFVNAYGGFSNLPQNDKSRVDEIINCIAMVVNEPPVTPQPRWIPVSERLPDTDDEVLCWYEYYHWSREKVLPEYGLGSYFKETESWFGEVANGHKVRVIAWMPLPAPFEPQEVRKTE